MADRLPPATWRRRRTSIALICIGLLMLVSSGLCSAFFGVGFLRDINQPGEAGMYARGLMWVVPLFGGPPMLVGLALLFWGLRRDRRG